MLLLLSCGSCYTSPNHRSRWSSPLPSEIPRLGVASRLAPIEAVTSYALISIMPSSLEISELKTKKLYVRMHELLSKHMDVHVEIS